MYIDQCNIANVNIDEMVQSTAIAKLLKGRNILWQVLAVHNATYQKPYKEIDPGIAKWKGKLETAFPEAVIHTYPHMQTFYRNTTTTEKQTPTTTQQKKTNNPTINNKKINETKTPPTNHYTTNLQPRIHLIPIKIQIPKHKTKFRIPRKNLFIVTRPHI